MTRSHPFGISTYLFHRQRLCREHLLEIAAAGFESLELRATAGHFDYHNPNHTADLQQWLAEAGLTLRVVHAPPGEDPSGRATAPLSLAAADPERRRKAVEETIQALHIGRRIAFQTFVIHLGGPQATEPAGESRRDAARRSVEEIADAARPLGVRIAIELLPNELSRAGSLAHFIEDSIDAPEVGINLDIGHALLEGDVVDAVETVSEHLFAVDVHDNHGRTDEHLVPFEGGVDWPAALTAIQKVGYEGPLMIELNPRGSTKEMLAKTRKARERLERLMAT